MWPFKRNNGKELRCKIRQIDPSMSVCYAGYWFITRRSGWSMWNHRDRRWMDHWHLESYWDFRYKNEYFFGEREDAEAEARGIIAGDRGHFSKSFSVYVEEG